MLDHWIRFVLSRRALVALGAAILAVAGVLAWRALPIDAFPDVTNVQVMVLTDAPGRAPEDVERQITFPIETAMQGLPRVEQVRSLSKSGLSQVVVVFEDGTDIYFARQRVFERLQTVRESLPADAAPELGPISTGLGEIYQYTVESDRHTAMELRTAQDGLIAPRLRALPGVNEVNSFGGYVKQYHVLARPARLLKHGIALRDVTEALERNNANAGGGFLVRGWEQADVRSVGLLRSEEDIGDVVLKASDGTPVFLRDVADIVIGAAPRQGAVTRDGRGEAVAGMVIMLRDANSHEVVERVRRAIPEIESSLPKGMRIRPFYDRTALIQACIGTVSGALAQGAVLVIAVLFLFLGNLRGALVAAVSLPVTACVVFLLMGWQGVTANLMSLGGLAIALGMVVDAAIVVTENVARHLAERGGTGAPRERTVLEAVSEVARPAVFAVLIIVIVFLPLYSLQAMEGKMFKPLALTMCLAMAGSLVAALTIVPVLAFWLLPAGGVSREPAVVRWIKRAYLPVLDAALRHRAWTMGVAAALLAVASLVAPRLGVEFLPALNEGAIAINVVRLPTASLEGSVNVGTLMERKLAAFPEVETVVTKTGRAEISEDPMGPEQNDVFIMLRPRSQWTTGRGSAELVAAIERELAVIPGVRLSFSQPIALRVNELISGVKGDLAVKVFGEDLAELKRAADRVAAALSGLPGAHDVKVEPIAGSVQIEIAVDRRAIARHKINVEDVNEIVEVAIGGKAVSQITEGTMRVDVVTRYPASQRSDVTAIARLLVAAPDGHQVPLGELATIREVEAPAQISREKGLRRVVVECNIRGRDMGGFVRAAQHRLQPVLAELPPGYFVEYGGQFENQRRAMRRLAIVVPLSIGLILTMLFATFRSMRDALLVLVNLPFALVGGVLLIYALGMNLSVSATVGFIALFGTAVENGILLVAFFNQLRAEGASPLEAVRRGCALRLRPLLMTALTTLLGLLPMIYATGSGSEIQRPLATVVLGGLATSVALTLLVLPALYLALEERRVRRATASA
jgi:cobalt-zinc-cadmium resistance protein CzcA